MQPTFTKKVVLNFERFEIETGTWKNVMAVECKVEIMDKEHHEIYFCCGYPRVRTDKSTQQLLQIHHVTIFTPHMV